MEILSVTLLHPLGLGKTVGGFVVSYYANLPTGACIVLASTAIFALAAAYRALSGPAQ